MQDELVSRIRRGIGLTYEEANEMLQPALLNYARFVHLLPASENHHHCGPGELLRHGLEVAYIAMNCSNNAAFYSRLPPSKRSLRNPRWIVAGSLCWLFHDTGKAVTDMRVVYAPEDLEWDYTSSSIEDWGKKKPAGEILYRVAEVQAQEAHHALKRFILCALPAQHPDLVARRW